jgi:excisionase family DNA binding protein
MAVNGLLTAREVAGRLRVSTETVLRWRRQGKLPAVVLPSGAVRFREDTLDGWLAERERATPSRGVSTTPASAARSLEYSSSTTPEVEED